MFSREQENSLHVFNISCDESYWRSHQKIIVTRSKYSHEDIVDLTASLVDAKDSEEAVGVETVQNTQEYCSLANTVFDWEDRGEWSIPSDISVLVHVDVKKESHKDGREASRNKFLEQETLLYQVERFRHIHQASVHLGPVPHEVVDGFYCCPGAHGGGAARLQGFLFILFVLLRICVSQLNILFHLSVKAAWTTSI